MKNLLTALVLGLCAVNARAANYYRLDQTASSATMKLGGVMKLAATTTATPTITLDGVAGKITANISQVNSDAIICGNSWQDIRCFGAVADNATDNSTAIQNAINAVSNNSAACTTGNCGGYVFVPAANLSYNYATTLKVSRGVVLVGANPFNTELKYTGTGFAVQLGTDTSANLSFGVGLRDLLVYAPNATASGGVVKLYGTEGALVDHNYLLSNVKAPAILIDGGNSSSFANHISNNYIENFSTGVYCSDSGNSNATYSTFVDNNFVNGSTGFDFGHTNGNDCSASFINGGDIENMSNAGIYLWPNAGKITAVGVRFESNGTDVFVATGAVFNSFSLYGVQKISSSTTSNATFLSATGNGVTFTNQMQNLQLTSTSNSPVPTLSLTGPIPELTMTDTTASGKTWFLASGYSGVGNLDAVLSGTGVGWTMTPNQALSVVAGVTATSMTVTATPGFKGDLTGATGTAASLTAGHVTTNANMSGDITSSGSNATTAAATQPNIATLSVAGGVTISNGVTSTTGTFTSGVTASSGTINGVLKVTGRTNFSGVAFSSSALNSVSITQTSALSCLASSTITWTSNGNPAYIRFDGTFNTTGANATLSDRVYLDGAPGVGTALATVKALDVVTIASGFDTGMSLGFTYRASAGTHTLCIAGWTNSAAINWCPSNNGGCEFSVTEY